MTRLRLLPGFLAVFLTAMLVCMSASATVHNSAGTRGLKQTGTGAPSPPARSPGPPSPGLQMNSPNSDANANNNALDISNYGCSDAYVTVHFENPSCSDISSAVRAGDMWTLTLPAGYAGCPPLKIDAVVHTSQGDINATPFEATRGIFQDYILGQTGDSYEVVPVFRRHPWHG